MPFSRHTCAVVLSLVLLGAALVGASRLPSYAAAEAPKAKYVGNEQNCKMCHSDIFAGWQKTAHARAFADLEAAGKSKDPACLACHTTGYGQGGYVDEATTPNLKNVQCEACHGPGGDHNGDKTKINGDPPARVCAKCHLQLGIHNR